MAHDRIPPFGHADDSPERRMADGISRMAEQEATPVDDLTRQRHLNAMRVAGGQRRRSFVVGAAAAAVIAVVAASIAVNNNGAPSPAALGAAECTGASNALGPAATAAAAVTFGPGSRRGPSRRARGGR